MKSYRWRSSLEQEEWFVPDADASLRASRVSRGSHWNVDRLPSLSAGNLEYPSTNKKTHYSNIEFYSIDHYKHCSQQVCHCSYKDTKFRMKASDQISRSDIWWVSQYNIRLEKCMAAGIKAKGGYELFGLVWPVHCLLHPGMAHLNNLTSRPG